MAKKAEAWSQYKDAAMVDMVLQVLPALAAAVAGEPIVYCALQKFF